MISQKTSQYDKEDKALYSIYEAAYQLLSALVCRSGTGPTSEAIICMSNTFNGLGGVMPQELIT